MKWAELRCSPTPSTAKLTAVLEMVLLGEAQAALSKGVVHGQRNKLCMDTPKSTDALCSKLNWMGLREKKDPKLGRYRMGTWD